MARSVWSSIAFSLLTTLYTWAQAPSIATFGNTFDGSRVAQIGGCGASTPDIVSVVGSNFVPGNTTVSVSGIRCSILTITSNYLEFEMPDVRTNPGVDFSGKITVRTNISSVQSALDLYATFCVTLPSEFIYKVGDIVTLTGSDMQNITGVSINGFNYPLPFNYIAASRQILIYTSAIPASVTDNLILRQNLTNELSVSPTFSFIKIDPPVIHSVTPLYGPTGSSVLIQGLNFAVPSENNIVYFGATPVSAFSGGNATQIYVPIPSGANYEKINLLNQNTNLSTSYDNSVTKRDFQLHLPITVAGLKPSDIAYENLVLPFAPYAITANDFDLDGRTDFAIVDETNGALKVLRNLSDRPNIPLALTFTGSIPAITNTIFGTNFTEYTVATGLVAASTFVLKTADIDGDGRSDVLIADNNLANFRIYRNSTSGPGNISFAPAYVLTYSGGVLHGNSENCLILRDIDSDGKPDIVFAENHFSDHITVIKNYCSPGKIGAITFSEPIRVITFSGNFVPTAMDLCDVDQDRKPDIVVAASNNSTNGEVRVYKNITPQGSLSGSSFANPLVVATHPTHSYFARLKTGDITYDALPDIVYSTDLAGNYSFHVLRNLTTGSVAFGAPVSFPITTTSVITDLDIADMDNNGSPDIAVLSDRLLTYVNQYSSGNVSASDFQLRTIFDPTTVLSGAINSITVIDVNNDKTNDVFLTHSSSTTGILYNTSCDPVTITNNFATTNLSITSGIGTIRFSVTASGSGLIYQWQQSTNSGVTWHSFSDGGIYSGSQSPNLNIIKPPAEWSGYQYRVLIANVCTVLSQITPPITVDGCVLPEIQLAPVSVFNVCTTSAVNFSVVATGVGNNFRWQQYVGGVWVDLSDGLGITGTSTAGLNILNPTLAYNNRRFRVAVTNICQIPVYSDGLSAIYFSEIPTISTQPLDYVLCEGTGNAFFNVSATGVLLNFQWQLSTDSGFNWSNIIDNSQYSGANTNTLLLITPDSTQNLHQFRVVVSNNCGVSAVSNGLSTLYVNNLPQIKVQPESPGGVCAGNGTLILTVGLQGQNISMHWQIFTLGGWNNLENNTTYFGVNNPSLTITNPEAGLNGVYYRITLTGSCITHAIVSESVPISVYNSAPIIVTQPTVPSAICEGSGFASLQVSASGVDLQYQWEQLENGIWSILPENDTYFGTSRNRLIIINPPLSLSGSYYRAKVTGSCSNQFVFTDSTRILIYAIPSISPNLENNCIKGRSFLRTQPDPNYRAYQWRINDADIYGDSSQTLVLRVSGNYSVYVNKNLRCLSAPYKYVYPATTTIVTVVGWGTPDDTLLQTVQVPGYQYQWYVQNKSIIGGTDFQLPVYYNGFYRVQIRTPDSCLLNSRTYVVNSNKYVDISRAEGFISDSSIYIKKPRLGNFRLVPNPARKRCWIQWDLTRVPNSIVIYNSTGTIVAEISDASKYEGGVELLLDAMAEGIYLIKVNSQDNIYEMKLMLIR